MARQRYTIDEVAEDDDDDEQEQYPSARERSVQGDRFEPTFEKCPHCDENGMIVTGTKHRVHYESGADWSMDRKDDCPACNGIGYIDVPTDEETKKDYILSGNTSDLVVLMRARYQSGRGLWCGRLQHPIRMFRHEFAVVEVTPE